MRLFLLSAAAGLAVFLCTSFAAAQGAACGDRQTFINHLRNKYGEFQVAQGVTGNKGLVEVFASEDRATWTILVTTSYGQTCMVGSGENWRTAKPKEPGEGT